MQIKNWSNIKRRSTSSIRKLICVCIFFGRRRTLRTNTWSMFTCEPKPLYGYSQTDGNSTSMPPTPQYSDAYNSLKSVNDVFITIDSDEEEIGPTNMRFVVIAIASIVFFFQVITYLLFE